MDKRIKEAIDYLKKEGYSDAAISSLIGTMQLESREFKSFYQNDNPDAILGVGGMMWSGNRREDFLKERDVEYAKAKKEGYKGTPEEFGLDPLFNVKYFNKEANKKPSYDIWNRGGSIDEFKKQTDPQKALEYLTITNVRPAGTPEAYASKDFSLVKDRDKRLEYTNNLFNTFSPTDVSTETDKTTQPGLVEENVVKDKITTQEPVVNNIVKEEEQQKLEPTEQTDLSNNIEVEDEPVTWNKPVETETNIEKQFKAQQNEQIAPFPVISPFNVPSKNANSISGDEVKIDPIYDFMKRDFSAEEKDKTREPELPIKDTESKAYADYNEANQELFKQTKAWTTGKNIYDALGTAGSFIANLVSKAPKGISPTLSPLPTLPTTKYQDQAKLESMLAGGYAGARQMAQTMGSPESVVGLTANLQDATAKGMGEIAGNELKRQTQEAGLQQNTIDRNTAIINQVAKDNKEREIAFQTDKANALSGNLKAGSTVLGNIVGTQASLGKQKNLMDLEARLMEINIPIEQVNKIISGLTNSYNTNVVGEDKSKMK